MDTNIRKKIELNESKMSKVLDVKVGEVVDHNEIVIIKKIIVSDKASKMLGIYPQDFKNPLSTI